MNSRKSLKLIGLLHGWLNCMQYTKNKRETIPNFNEVIARAPAKYYDFLLDDY